MKKIIITITLVCLAVVLALEPISLAWMSDNGMSSPVSITSNVHKSYFESGDGTSTLNYDSNGNIIAGPFEIARPIQLYYFAWLQYLGYFNKDGDDDDTKIDTYYFRISTDLDMTGYVLPPIGTQTNPFLGNLDGEGHTIKNLTVQNQSGLTEPPSNVSSLTGVEIVGFFGVIGELAEGDYSYEKSVNQVTNLVLENLTVQTQTDKALIGLAAGYVNGTVDCVGVVSSTVVIDKDMTKSPLSYTTNYSDYSLIGYCTKDYKANVNVMDVNLTQPKEAGPYDIIPETGGGNVTGWGGSLAMQSIFDLIGGAGATENRNYITARVDLVGLDGTAYTLESSTSTKQTATKTSFGSFVFTQTTMNNGGGGRPGSGSSTRTIINFIGGSQGVTEIRYVQSTSKTVDLYYITDGTNYLCFDGSNITNTETKDDATQWYASNNKSGGKVFTVVGGRVYYLTIENNEITTVWKVNPIDANLPTWTVTDGDLRFNSQRIKCVGDEWQVDTTTSYKISNGNGHYLSVDGTDGIKDTNATNATVWTINTSSTTTTISTVIGQTTYYLVRNDNGSLDISSNTSTNWRYDATNQRFYVEVQTGNWWQTTDYYINYSSNGWSTNDDQYGVILTGIWGDIQTVKVDDSSELTGPEITVTQSAPSIDNSLINYKYDENGKEDPTGTTDTAGLTYIPLSFSGYSVNNTNTGYIIGSDWDNPNNSNNNADTNASNIRISQYPISSLRGGQNTASTADNEKTPYVISHLTYDMDMLPQLPELPDSKTKITPEQLNAISGTGVFKYTDAYGAYYTSVESACYGLHFMNAPVSEENIATITANLHGSEITGYEVPTNCIDFSLNKKGFINAVAGTYYSQGDGNDSFFSIYHISRSGTEITGIKEISQIYGKLTPSGKIDRSEEYDYVYVYTDGSTSGSTAGLKPIFDCAWLTNTKSVFASNGWAMNRAYYFEVPVNAGEYAIGSSSTEDRNGAYLLYLDLAANTQILERTKEYEEITEIRGSGSYPLGVELFEANNITKDTNNNVIVDPASSAFAAISNATGTITFTKTDANTVTHTATSGTYATYIGPGRYLKDGNGYYLSMPAKTTLIQRTTYRDYNPSNEETTVTVITQTTVNGTTTETRQQFINGAPVIDDLVSFIPDAEEYEPGGGNLVSLSFNYTSTDVSLSYSYDSANNRYDVTIPSNATSDIVVKLSWSNTTGNVKVYINGELIAAGTPSYTVAATSGT